MKRRPIARRRRIEHSADDVVIAMTVAARIVQLHGRAYVRLFERMEGECDARRRLHAALRRAGRVASTLQDVGVAGFIDHWRAVNASEGA